jgi:cytochrome c
MKMNFPERMKPLTLVLLLLPFFFSCGGKNEEKILVFSKTTGFRHESIEAGKKALMKLGETHGFQVDTTENSAFFHEDTLKNYSAVVFLNTTGDVLDHRQQADFERYIQAGGGFIGVHSATDTEYHWPWYGKMVGGWFNGHPNDPNVRKGKLQVLQKDHPSTKHLPDEWMWEDEYYDFKSFNESVKVLITVDEQSYGGGKHGSFHPMAWYHDYDGGRAFYTGLGHSPEHYSETMFLEHLLGGIRYAIGDNQRNYNKATSLRVPEANRFVKKVFVNNLDEPMELEVLKNGKILFIERKGAIKLYDPKTDVLKVVAKLPVHTKFEDGLLGLALDPDFENNYRLYLYYSPVGDKPIQRVSRFTMLGDSLILASEKVVLEIDVQREQCCHSAGSMEFGPDGNLFIALGDDTSPFNTQQKYDADGFAPMDERPGRGPYDAQKSSGNPNDLRGKILRIKPLPDGSYTIPDGNLFAKDGTEGRPEIYVMGCRNPYRMFVDKKTGWLFWGDVGPDAGNDNPNRGPRGYDELNLAKGPGFYGWPYFVGNNRPYRKMNYETGEVTDFFDPLRPVNTSPNNTGVRELPPAQPALIWYPYAETKEFPHMGTGGRNSMAGPVYYYNDYPASKNRFPQYYDHKFLHYDWSRNWVHAVTLDANGRYVKQEPFLEHFQFEKIIDMQLAADGTLYLLEYGSNWFAQNPDAVLAQIDYAEGNRHPIAKISAEGLVGAAPFEVKFSAEGSFDYDDQDELRYEWYFTDQNKPQASGLATSFVFDKPGVYKPKVKVVDKDGAYAVAELEVRVGNERPVVDIVLAGNQSFYWGPEPFGYEVRVTDREDGPVEEERVLVFFDYMPVGLDLAEVAIGHKQTGAVLDGKKLIDEKGCKTCHAMNEISVGPSYQMIAQRYGNDEPTTQKLAHKVINGGGGVWGDRAMAANVSLTNEESEAMVKYILALDEKNAKPSLPVKGELVTNKHTEQQRGMYLITAEYTDKGGQVIGPLTARKTVKLRHPQVQGADYDNYHQLGKRRPGGTSDTFLDRIKGGSWFMYEGIDLQGVASISVKHAVLKGPGFTIQARVGSPEGEVIASASLPFTTGKADSWSTTDLVLTKKVKGLNNLYFTFGFEGEEQAASVMVDWLYFHKEVPKTLATR